MNMMKLTKEERKKIHLLSDGELYRDALSLAKEHKYLKNHKELRSQLSGLENIVRSHELGQIIDFAKKKTKRDTLSDDLKDLYRDLVSYLESLYQKVKEEYQLVIIPENVSRSQKKQFNKEAEEYAYLLAKEFVQHLVAEINYQRSQ